MGQYVLDGRDIQYCMGWDGIVRWMISEWTGYKSWQAYMGWLHRMDGKFEMYGFLEWAGFRGWMR